MKKSVFLGILLIGLVVCLFAFRGRQSTIIGRINPVDAAEMLWAINTNNIDSIKVTPSVDGRFSITVKPGTYRVVVIAKPPYKNTAVENVLAREGETADTGEITILK